MKNDKEEVILGRKGRQLHTAKAGARRIHSHFYITIFTITCIRIGQYKLALYLDPYRFYNITGSQIVRLKGQRPEYRKRILPIRIGIHLE